MTVPNKAAAQQRAAAAAKKALEILDDPKLTNDAKMKAIAPFEEVIKDVDDEIKLIDARSVLLGAGGSKGIPGDQYAGHIGNRAPSLAIVPDEQEALFKALNARGRYETKATTTGDVPPSEIPTQYLQPVLAAFEPTRILELLPTTTMSSSSVDYYREHFTNAAGPISEGELKPRSDLGLTKVNAPATKIAHFSDVTEEVLEDFPAFSQWLSNAMINGLIDAENRELLFGNPTTHADSKFEGLMIVDGTGGYTRTGDDNILDALEIGATGLRAGGQFVSATGYVMNPLDYSKARRTKSTTGEYLAGDPTEKGPATLWGLPVVLTTEMPEGTAVASAFARAAMVWIRKAPEYRTDNGMGDDRFQRNKIAVIGEERLALGVLAPAAISIIDITAP